MNSLTVVPAYGRDYKSVAQVKADVATDKDFLIQDMSSPHNGRYCNAPQLREAGYSTVRVRYNKLRSVANVAL